MILRWCVVLVVLIFFFSLNLPGSEARNSEPNSKITADLLERIHSSPPDEKIRAIIILEKPESNIHAQVARNSVKKDIMNKGGKVRREYSIFEGVAVEISAAKMEALTHNPNIELIVEDKPVKAFLTESVPLINADDVWSKVHDGNNITGKGQTVCVIDTGVDYNHPDLGGGKGSGFKVLGGYDYVNDDSDPIDDHGHGTHVAGTIAANGNLKGVAPEANIIAIKSLDSGGTGSFSDIIAGIDWCVNNADTYDITVISMSLGSDPTYSSYCDSDDTPSRDAINAAVANNISVVVATGNDASSTGISSPACIQNATRVGATDKSDGIASFSNRGANFPDILLAPGVDINSTWLSEGYYTAQGTSMATPHVSGLIALLNQKSGASQTPSQIFETINSTGVPIYDSGVGKTYYRIDALQAYSGTNATNATVISNCTALVQNNTGANFTSIQEAVDNSTSGATITVGNGTCSENIKISKTINIFGAGSGRSIVTANNKYDYTFNVTNATNVNISGFTVNGSDGYLMTGIYLSNTNFSKIANNSVMGNYYGIYLTSSNSNLIINNSASSNEWNGVYVDRSNNNSILNNTANSNEWHGISLLSSNNTIIENNTVNSNNYYGIFISASNGSNVENNTVNSNGYYGIYLSKSSLNSIKLNTVKENPHWDFFIDASSDNHCNNYIVNNTITGGQNVMFINESRNLSNTTYPELILCNADNSNITNVTIFSSVATKNNGLLLVRTDNVNLTNITSSYNYHGIYLTGSSRYNTIARSNLTFNNQAGIRLDNSSFNTQTDNTISNNRYGVHVDSAKSNTLSNNDIRLNTENGIYLSASYYGNTSYNQISNNNISSNIKNGIYLYSYYYSIVNSNKVYDNTITSNIENGIEISSSYYSKTSSNNISSNTITSNTMNGIYLSSSYLSNTDSNAISENAITSNQQHGLYLYSGFSFLLLNTINKNTVLSNTQNGIFLHNSDVNTISNNTFVSNGENGIYLNKSSGSNTLFNNTCSSNNASGIKLGNKSNSNTINRNNVSNNNYGIYQDYCNGSEISNNTISSNNNSGIYIGRYRSVISQDNVIQNNIVLNNRDGIYLNLINKTNLINNTVGSNNNYGIHLDTITNNTLENNTVPNNLKYGIFIEDSVENTIINNSITENKFWDIFVSVTDNAFCDNQVANNTGSGNRPIRYYGSQTTYGNETLSELILCNADNSNIINVTINGSSTIKNNGFYALNTDSSNLIDIKSYSNYHGIYLKTSKTNTLNDSFVKSNNESGIYLDFSDENLFRRANATSNKNGIVIYNSSSNIIINSKANLSTENGVYLESSTLNAFASSIASDNKYGIYINRSNTNFVENDTTIESNSEAGIYLEYSNSNNIRNNVTTTNNKNGIVLSGSNFNHINDAPFGVSVNTVNSNTENGLSFYSSHNNTIFYHFIKLNGKHGIYLESSTNNDIIDADVLGLGIGNPFYGIYLTSSSSSNNIILSILSKWSRGISIENSNNNIINNNDFTQNGYGIYNKDSDQGTIVYNDITNNDYGITLKQSETNTINNNSLSSNERGIYLFDSANSNTLYNNTASQNQYGIYLEGPANNNQITKNTIKLNTYSGIFSTSTTSNTVSYNDVSNNSKGITFNLSGVNTLTDNTIRDNNESGIELGSSTGISVTTNSLSNNNYGVKLHSSNSSILTGNTIVSNNQSGIHLISTKSNILRNNNASVNKDGIRLDNSINATIRDNIVGSNSDIGIYLSSSINNSIIENTITNNDHGIGLYSSNNNTIIGTSSVLNNRSGIYLETSLNNTITNNNLSHNQYGIHLNTSNSTSLTNNTLRSNNVSGIYLETSCINNLTENIVVSNSLGIILLSSNDNSIYNNHFNNTKNFNFSGTNSNDWNTTKTSGANILGNPYIGGNFWAYPNGTGISATCTDANNDSICDSTYVLASGNIDYIPLAKDMGQPSPSVTIISPQNKTYNTSSIVINVSAIDPSSIGSVVAEISGSVNVTLSNNSGTYYNYTYTFSDGEISVRIYVNDTLGNLNSTEVVYFTVDTTPPNITILSPANSTTNDSTPLLNVSFNERVNYTWYNVNGTGNSSYFVNTSNITTDLTTLGEGQHNITIFANDSQGNLNTTRLFFTVDTIAPKVFTNLSNTTYTSSNLSIQLDISDANPYNVWYKLDGGSNSSPYLPNSTRNLTSLSDGHHNVTIYGNDSAGNLNSTTVFFTVDTTPPQITLSSPTNASTMDTTPLLNATFDEGVNYTWYSVDSGANSTLVPNVSNLTTNLTTLSEGQHSVTVYANDSLGNLNSSTVFFTVDTARPTIRIYSPTNTTYDTANLALTVSADEQIDTWRYSLNGGANTTFTPNATITAVSGTNTLVVYANDSAGNLNSSTVHFGADILAPQIDVINPAQVEATSSANITVTIAELRSDRYFVLKNGTEIANGTYSHNIPFNVSIDTAIITTWNYTVYANDSLGNTNSTTVLVTILDTSAPLITVIRPKIGEIFAATNMTKLELRVTDYNLSVLGYRLYSTTSLVYSNTTANSSGGQVETYSNHSITLPDGDYTYTIYANDSSGNLSVKNVTFRVNTTLFEGNNSNISVNSMLVGNNSLLNSSVNGTSYIEDSNLTNSNVTDSNITDSIIIDSNVSDSYIDPTTLIDCDVDSSNITDSNLTTSLINGGSILHSVVAYNLNITNSTLMNATVYNSRIIANVIDGSTNATIEINVSGITINFTKVYENASLTQLITAVNTSTQNLGAGVEKVVASNTSAGYSINVTANTAINGNFEAALTVINPGGMGLSNKVSGTRFLYINASDFNSSTMKNATLAMKYSGSYTGLSCVWFNRSNSSWEAIPSWTSGSYVYCNTSHFSDFAITGTPSVKVVTSSGGGGGGGGGETKGVIIKKIEAGSSSTATFDLEDTGYISEITLQAKDTAYNVKVVAEALDKKPFPTMVDPEGLVLSYLKLTKSGITNTQLEKADVTFQVPLSWLMENDINQDTVFLLRDANNKWDKMDTIYLSEDEVYVYYTAETPGFSYFVITGVPGSGYVEPVEEEEVVVETIPEEQPSEKEPPGQPSLTVDRSTDKISAFMGENITVEIFIRNIGEATAANIFYEDEIPGGFRVVEGDNFWRGVLGPGETHFNTYVIQILPAEDKETYTLSELIVTYRDQEGNLFTKSSPSTAISVQAPPPSGKGLIIVLVAFILVAMMAGIALMALHISGKIDLIIATAMFKEKYLKIPVDELATVVDVEEERREVEVKAPSKVKLLEMPVIEKITPLDDAGLKQSTPTKAKPSRQDLETQFLKIYHEYHSKGQLPPNEVIRKSLGISATDLDTLIAGLKDRLRKGPSGGS